MARLIVLGAGGHGKVSAGIAADMGNWDSIAFLDDRFEQLGSVAGHKVLGPFNAFEEFSKDDDDFFVALGNNKQRVNWVGELEAKNLSVPCLVHPTAWIAPSAKLGAGTLVGPQAVVHVDTRIGTGCIINTSATVDHDGVLEEGVHISPGVHVAGEVQVGAYTSIGVGASVANQIRIGRQVVLGAGSVVVESLPDNVTAAGVPAKIIKSP